MSPSLQQVLNRSHHDGLLSVVRRLKQNQRLKCILWDKSYLFLHSSFSLQTLSSCGTVPAKKVILKTAWNNGFTETRRKALYSDEQDKQDAVCLIESVVVGVFLKAISCLSCSSR
jgi:hypothetical protein